MLFRFLNRPVTNTLNYGNVMIHGGLNSFNSKLCFDCWKINAAEALYIDMIL